MLPSVISSPLRQAAPLLGSLLIVSGCAAPATHPSSVPSEFRPACGKPGTEVVTKALRVVIQRRECDLTGVVIINQGRGVTVPASGGLNNSMGVNVEVAQSGDVTFTAEAEVGSQ